MSHPRCSSCRFFQREARANDGLCRRNTPRLNEGGTMGRWPCVYDTDWCGEWQAKPTKAKLVKLPEGGA